MPGFKVRYSKFRHVYGQPFRREQCYDSVRISRNTFDGNFCAVNPKFLAVVTESGGGGAFMVIPIEKCGRINPNTPRVLGHSGPVLDIKWYPFNDNIIASSSEDGTVMLWEIPEGGLKENLTESLMQLRGHGRKCGYIEWHPTASSILASGGFDGQVIIWNVDSREPIASLGCENNPVLSLSFSWNGSLIAVTSKDKKLRLFDPRTEELLQEGICHSGMKSPKCVFVGDCDYLVTVGSSQGSQREMSLWDQNDFSKPLATAEMGNGTGVLFPYVDHDNNVVYVAGKGDGNIRFFEILESTPYLYALNEFVSGQPQRGMGSMPKRGLNTASCEVMRFYKLHATKGCIEPVSMIVPRRYDTLQRDLYPDTAGPEPALTAGEWVSGIDRLPILISLGGVSRKVKESQPRSRPAPLGKEGAAGGEKMSSSLTRRNHSDDSQDRRNESKKLKQDEAPSKYETEAMEKVKIVPDSSKGASSSRSDEKHMEVFEESESKQSMSDSSQGTDSKDGSRMGGEVLDSRDVVVEEESILVTANDVVKSAPITSDDSRMDWTPASTGAQAQDDAPGSHTPPRSHLTGMEGSMSVSQRLARWQNNNNQASYGSKYAEQETSSGGGLYYKPDKRTHVLYQGPLSPEQRSKGKAERSHSESGKETFQSERSVLPPIRKSSQQSTLDAPRSPARKTSLPDRSGDGKEPLASSDMGADQIRKAYLRQQEEIKQLKSQLLLKDARIRQLERELDQYTTTNC